MDEPVRCWNVCDAVVLEYGQIPLTAVRYHILSIWSTTIVISAIFPQLRSSNTLHGAHFEAEIVFYAISVFIDINPSHLYRCKLCSYVLQINLFLFPL